MLVDSCHFYLLNNSIHKTLFIYCLSLFPLKFIRHSVLIVALYIRYTKNFPKSSEYFDINFNRKFVFDFLKYFQSIFLSGFVFGTQSLLAPGNIDIHKVINSISKWSEQRFFFLHLGVLIIKRNRNKQHLSNIQMVIINLLTLNFKIHLNLWQPLLILTKGMFQSKVIMSCYKW